MQKPVTPDNRRESDRFALVLPVQTRSSASRGAAPVRGRTSNISRGGACIELDGAAPEIGSTVTLAFAVPGRREPIEVDGEVRWTAGVAKRRCGVMFRKGHERLLTAIVAVLVSTTAPVAMASSRVPTFDPDADTELDLDAGGERPSKHEVLEALAEQYDRIDACVTTSKPDPDVELEGDAHVAVLLNPAGATPLGVNAELPAALKKHGELKECLRSAVARANYPSYDGPPVVVEFELELDPGYEEVPAE